MVVCLVIVVNRIRSCIHTTHFACIGVFAGLQGWYGMAALSSKLAAWVSTRVGAKGSFPVLYIYHSVGPSRTAQREENYEPGRHLPLH